MAERELRIRLNAAGDGEVRAKLDGLGGSFSRLGASAISLNQALELGRKAYRFVVNDLAGMVTGALATADAFGEAAEKTGVNVERLQELTYAASQAGASQGTLERGVEGFTRRLGEAEQGTGSLQSFLEKYDATLLDSIKNTESSADAFDLAAGALAREQDAAQRAALATALFGRAGIDLIPMLSGGKEGLDQMAAEARKLGLVLSKDTVDAAARAGDQLDKLSSVVSAGLTQSLVSFAPWIERTVASIVDATPKVVAFFESLFPPRLPAASPLADVNAEIVKLAGQLAKLEAKKGVFGVVMGNATAIRAEMDRLKELRAEILGIGESSDTAGGQVRALTDDTSQLAQMSKRAAAIGAAWNTTLKLGADTAGQLGRVVTDASGTIRVLTAETGESTRGQLSFASSIQAVTTATKQDEAAQRSIIEVLREKRAAIDDVRAARFADLEAAKAAAREEAAIARQKQDERFASALGVNAQIDLGPALEGFREAIASAAGDTARLAEVLRAIAAFRQANSTLFQPGPQLTNTAGRAADPTGSAFRDSVVGQTRQLQALEQQLSRALLGAPGLQTRPRDVTDPIVAAIRESAARNEAAARETARSISGGIAGALTVRAASTVRSITGGGVSSGF